STVCYALLGKALGNEHVRGLHIDNGFMRKNESAFVMKALEHQGLHLEFVDASQQFIDALQGITDPEEKRKIIGEVFVKVAQDAMRDMHTEGWLLAQGTIYPDTIESQGTKHAALIKTHHNRVEVMRQLLKEGKVIEPIKQLYKDEVRALGVALGLPSALVNRKPFPGPGLAVRCLCNAEESFDHPDNGRLQEMVLPLKGVIAPVKSVGVQGDERTYKHPAIIYGGADWDQLDALSSIPNKLPSVNRMIYLLSPSVPPLSLKKATLTRQRLSLLRDIDALVRESTSKNGSNDLWQFPVIMAPMGNVHGESIILRPVHSQEAMTATYAKLDLGQMKVLAERIRSMGIDAVYYDFTTKPPGTIEWE
ncbi:MAG: glutamine-hydrolyzing GMP synthase, partial [Nanoarchaeota archaeon]